MTESKTSYHFSGKSIVGSDISYKSKLTEEHKTFLKDTKKQILKSINAGRHLEGEILSDISDNDSLFAQDTVPAYFSQLNCFDIGIRELLCECKVIQIGLEYHTPKTKCEKLLTKHLKIALRELTKYYNAQE